MATMLKSTSKPADDKKAPPPKDKADAKPAGKPTPAGGAAMAQEASAGGDMSPQGVMSKLHLSPQQQDQLQRIVVAGLRVMFDAKTHKLMLKQLDGPDPLPHKVGTGVAGLVALLLRESNNTIPPNLLIPAGLVLVAYACQWVSQSGQPMSPQDVGMAMRTMVEAVLRAGGVDPGKLAAMGERAGAPQ